MFGSPKTLRCPIFIPLVHPAIPTVTPSPSHGRCIRARAYSIGSRGTRPICQPIVNISTVYCKHITDSRARNHPNTTTHNEPTWGGLLRTACHNAHQLLFLLSSLSHACLPGCCLLAVCPRPASDADGKSAVLFAVGSGLLAIGG